MPNTSASDPRIEFNPNYPLVEDLRRRAKRRMPGFAYDYLTGGCNEEQGLSRNVAEWNDVRLNPRYLRNYQGSDLSQSVFEKKYSAPIGIAPVGLQGMMWPNACEILAKAASFHEVPFILSTVTTASIETIGEITSGNFWYQLYHPAEQAIRDDILNRAHDAGCQVLVVTADVPTFGYRAREYKNRLAMPPKMTFQNIRQMCARPVWATQSLKYGVPQFATMKKYMPKNMDIKQLGRYMKENFAGRITTNKLKSLRDQWKGKLVVKGMGSKDDMELALSIGVDGVILSNHGGRQLEPAESTVATLKRLGPEYHDKLELMIDGGVRSGVDVARAMALGASFVFAGRPFMYGVGALGRQGGNHAISIFKLQLTQVMQQLGCAAIEDLPDHLILTP